MNSRSDVAERLRTPEPGVPPVDDAFFEQLGALAAASVPRPSVVRPSAVRVVAAAAGVALVTTGVAVAVDQLAAPDRDTPVQPADDPTPEPQRLERDAGRPGTTSADRDHGSRVGHRPHRAANGAVDAAPGAGVRQGAEPDDGPDTSGSGQQVGPTGQPPGAQEDDPRQDADHQDDADEPRDASDTDQDTDDDHGQGQSGDPSGDRDVDGDGDQQQ
jgi:hypothetical protein